MAKIVLGEENFNQNKPNQSSLKRRMLTTEKLVLELMIPKHKENALLDLSKVLHILYLTSSAFETLYKVFPL